MSLFSETLSEYIKTKKIKIYQIANLTGIDRTWIQKMITGKRKPSDKSQVLNLSRALSLTHSETEHLINTYYILEMGEENWKRRQIIQKLIQSFHLDENPLHISYPSSEFSLSKCCDTKILHTTININRALHSILLQESVNPNGFVKMFVQPDYSFILNCLTAIDFEHISIEHFLCLDSAPSQEVANLETIRQIVPLLLSCKNYVPYGYYDHTKSIFSSSIFLPNTILTSQYMVQISSDYTEAIITNHPDLLSLCHKYFEIQKNSSWPIFQPIKSFEEYLHLMLSETPPSVSYCIMDHPCVLSFLSLDIIQRVLNFSLVEPTVFNQLQAHFQNFSDTPISTYSFFSMEGLRKFSESGVFTEVPLKFYSPLNSQETRYLIQRIVSFTESGYYHPRIFHPVGFKIPENLCVGTTSRQKAIIIFNHPQKGFLAFDVKNLSLSSAIYDFMEYIQSEKNMTYSEEESSRIIHDFLENTKLTN